MDEIVVFHPLAQEILAGRFQPGETIDVSVANGDLVLTSAVTAELVD